MTDFRRLLVGGLLLWVFFSFSFSVHQAQHVSAGNNVFPPPPATPTVPAIPGTNTGSQINTNSSSSGSVNLPGSTPTGTTALPLGSTSYPGVDITKYLGDSTGAQGVVEVLQNLFLTAKKILAPILVFLIGGFGIRLIIAGGDEEAFNAASKNFLYLLIGTAFVVLANFLTETFSLYQTGTGGTTTFVSGPEQILSTTQRIKDQLGLVISFLRYLLGGIAVFYVVRSGSAMIINADEETANKQKEVFIYGFVGFLIIMISEALVRTVFNINPTGGPFGSFFVEAQVDVSGGLSLISNITNLFLAGLSGLFLFSLVAGGALYAFSAGNEERGQQATKVIVGSLIGLVIAFSSYTLVTEFSSGGQPPKVAPTGTTPLLPLTTAPVPPPSP